MKEIYINGFAWYVNIITGAMYEDFKGTNPVPMNALTINEKQQLANKIEDIRNIELFKYVNN